jgi:hypothetical protein
MHDRAKAARNARYYRRKRDGTIVASVEVDGPILNFLEKARWLSARDAHDASKVAAAIKACLELSAKIRAHFSPYARAHYARARKAKNV